MQQEYPELKDTKIIRLIVDDRYQVLRHVMLLGFLALIISTNEELQYPGPFNYLRLICMYSVLTILCYVNMNVLVSRFFFHGRYFLYLTLLLLLVVAGVLLLSFLFNKLLISPYGMRIKRGYFEGTIILMPFVLVTTMIKLFQRWMRDKERMTALRNITLTMELNELRNQINPHFLFNMLNGIKALVRSDPERAGIVIMKLSEFLRYQLYENNEEKTLLRSEINFLSNFLELEKLRRDSLSVGISSNTDAAILHRIFLPPNLFTTFVENAVKHSVTISGDASYIRASIAVNNDTLCFNCVNSIDPEYIPSDGKNSGLGLANIRRRLELLYGDQYMLETTSTENEYNITLTIPI